MGVNCLHGENVLDELYGHTALQHCHHIGCRQYVLCVHDAHVGRHIVIHGLDWLVHPQPLLTRHPGHEALVGHVAEAKLATLGLDIHVDPQVVDNKAWSFESKSASLACRALNWPSRWHWLLNVHGLHQSSRNARHAKR